MSNISPLKEPYRAVTKGEWQAMEEFFNNDEGFSILYPMTVAEDNAFHIAVHSKREEPLKQLLEQVDVHLYASFLNTTNAYENTVLHEAAINHNIKAVKLLVEGRHVTPDQQVSAEERGYVTPKQLLEPNMSGQTPLFKAAAFGSTKVVKYLASQPYQMTYSDNGHKKLQDAHRINNDGFSILHAAVRGEHFGTALELLKLDEGLAKLKTENGMTSLHLLTNLRSAFTNKFSDHLWLRLLYHCIPTGDDNYDDADNIFDSEVNPSPQGNITREIWVEKRKVNFAFKLARKLIKNDYSWDIRRYTKDPTREYRSSTVDKKDKKDDEEVPVETPLLATTNKPVETPLLAATRTGVIELVKEILNMHPQVVEHVSHKKQNILHVAASCRQREIFELVKQMQMPTSRLILGIDEDSYTVLHHVADTRNYTGGTRAGPAYQLQEEFEWFQRVQKIMPSYFTQHLNKSNQTAQELFKVMHKDQLKEAQQWIKETSQSCSGVAVLVATVVFAAAFTVPGGTRDDNGLPILIYSPFFMFFTVMDVVSLSCSLTAVVMFLSIVTSPFDLDNFRVSLPRRLTLGFALLFISVATTMLAFTSTIILIIRSDQHRQWTLTLICCAAFVPVSVLALTHFPLFVSFIKAWNYLIALPCSSLLRILTFLGKLVLQRGLRFLNFLRNLVRQDDHPRLENERNV
ncbi:hypothetical protein EZV62_026217 [Acer yangbiense]|uniref:PGG domain-containing protein n=1 Tax=Acer yangbiense TaxID=1000413 RepID=A0A5C7GQR1_9ROSI|nr:hypothetical protein EZV62_026217 [Acer yangbiense]